MLNIHIRINDAATRRPTPVRVRVSDAAGKAYAPLGRLPVFAVGKGEDVGGQVRLGRDNWYPIDGGCEVPLPAGIPLRIQATKGPEYTPLDETITLGAGQISLRFEIARWHESDGVTVDTRAHFLSPHAALLEAAAEGIDVVNVLALVHGFVGQDGNGYPMLSNITSFSGQTPALTSGGHDVYVNTLNAHHALGRLGLLNSHRVVHPLTFGDPDGPDDWSLLDWCGQCHRKCGLVVWVDAFRSDRGILGGEALAALLLGQVDAIEFDAQARPQPLLPWVYKLWDCGVKVPLVGGSGKESNRTPVGAMRTLAFQASRVSDDAGEPNPTVHTVGSPRDRLLDSVRTGNTVVTNGPLLAFAATVDRAAATVESVVPFDKLEIVGNGSVLTTTPATADNGRYRATLELAHSVTDGWLAARAVGPKGSLLFPDQPVFAHSSAVFVGTPVRPPKALTALRQCLASTREWVETQGRFTADKFKVKLLDTLAAAEALVGAGRVSDGLESEPDA